MAEQNKADESTDPATTPEDQPKASVKPNDTDVDPKTDKAVDDIMKSDGDEVLKTQDERAEKAVVMKSSLWERFKNWNANWWADPRKRWSVVAGLVVVLAALFAVPFTRYNILGLALTAPVTVKVVDSKSGAPVSGVTVQLAGKTAETQANGKAVLHVHAGSKTLQVSKKYYQGGTQGKLVALSGNNFKASLVATGRQVKIKLVNKVSNKPVVGATVSAGGARAKTDKNGLATLVIASGADTQAASITLSGYNDSKVTVTAAGDLAKNTFSLVPAGKLYFLSNLSGSIDVVKTNLDGTDRQTVLAGTGSEDKANTSLLASRDWKYLVLLSKRSGDNASVYLIDTTNGDKLTTIDEGNASFSLIGWSGDRFIYQVSRNSVSNWQPNQQALKSFDPTTGHTLLLDQTQGSGTDQNNYARQQFGGSYLIDNQVVYTKTWYGYGSNVLNGKSAEIDTIGADGSGHKNLKSFSPSNLSGYGYFNINLSTELYEPQGIYIYFQHDGTDDFYDYDDGSISADTALTQDKFYQDYNATTYLLSPSDSNTFWSESRDGKNTLLVGDQDAKSPKTIASLSDYNTYGWFTDDYLLVSKSSSELYIMPAGGGTPLKITDYYKPSINYYGYGGGYGGL